MEENSTTRELRYDFMDHFTDALLTDALKDPQDMRTIAINHGRFSSFNGSDLEIGNYHFNTEGEELIVEKDGKEIGRCSNEAFIFDWLIGMAIYLKRRNLVEDFMKFYMFNE